jgi:hypothetical protein
MAEPQKLWVPEAPVAAHVLLDEDTASMAIVPSRLIIVVSAASVPRV